MTTLLGYLLPLAQLPTLVWWAIVFFVIALIAFLFGARGVAGLSAGVGKMLLFVFLVLAIIFALFGLLGA